MPPTLFIMLAFLLALSNDVYFLPLKTPFNVAKDNILEIFERDIVG